MSDVEPVMVSEHGRKVHLRPGKFHVGGVRDGVLYFGATVDKEDNAIALARLGIRTGIADRYVIVKPSGHLDVPDVVIEVTE